MSEYTNLPIVGRVQHGEKDGNKVKELGHFIAKVQDSYMQKFLQKFDEMFKGKKYLEIEFCGDNPLTKKFARYNQSGEICHCFEGNSNGEQKVKGKWEPIECNEQCQYRQKNASGKCACNRIGWLKFFIPDVCQDRIWLMKITGQTSINKLDSYINLQKSQGNSLKGRYILFLKQEQQTSRATGQTFNNYILDIVKKENFILENQTPEKNENQKKLSTNTTQTVNNKVEKEQTSAPKSKVTQITEAPKTQEAKTKKKTKVENEKTKKSEDNITELNIDTETKNDFDNAYGLLKTFKETITNKGQEKEYLIGEFCDMKDQIVHIAIKPEFADELLECDLGTYVKLDVKEVGGKLFAMNLEYIQKFKKIAA